MDESMSHHSENDSTNNDIQSKNSSSSRLSETYTVNDFVLVQPGSEFAGNKNMAEKRNPANLQEVRADVHIDGLSDCEISSDPRNGKGIYVLPSNFSSTQSVNPVGAAMKDTSSSVVVNVEGCASPERMMRQEETSQTTEHEESKDKEYSIDYRSDASRSSDYDNSHCDRDNDECVKRNLQSSKLRKKFEQDATTSPRNAGEINTGKMSKMSSRSRLSNDSGEATPRINLSPSVCVNNFPANKTESETISNSNHSAKTNLGYEADNEAKTSKQQDYFPNRSVLYDVEKPSKQKFGLLEALKPGTLSPTPVESTSQGDKGKLTQRRRMKSGLTLTTPSPNLSFTRTTTPVSAESTSKLKRAIEVATASVRFSGRYSMNSDSEDTSFSFMKSKPSTAVGKAMMMGLGKGGGYKGLRADLPDDLRTVDTTLLYRIIKPLYVLMRMCGMFFIRKPGVKPWMNPVFLYCFLTWIIAVINFCRSLTTFNYLNGFSYVIGSKIAWILIWYEGLSRVSWSLYLWYKKKNGFQDVFIQMDTLFYTDEIVPYEVAIRKMTFKIIFALVCLVLASTGMFAWGLFGHDLHLSIIYMPSLLPYASPTTSYFTRLGQGAPGDVPEEYQAAINDAIEQGHPLPDPTSSSIADYAIKSTVTLMVFWSTSTSMLFVAFYTIICYVLYKEFEYLGRTFEMKIAPDGTFMDDIDKFRIMHQKRSKIVELIDDLFKQFIANSYTVQVVAICLLVYCLLEPNSSNLTIISGVYWLLYFALQTAIVSVGAIAVNVQAHVMLASIYGIRASNASVERQIEIGMFLNKLTGTPIAFTAWDMFVVNKMAILTLIGAVSTLFFLLMQFTNPLSPNVNVNCNCSVAGE